ncbi:MAG: hypothetical protein JST92_13380 [Deltaproteobacteria bacterium]|nr:hypothetical protein [Deltaproteobacteria bacterium]
MEWTAVDANWKLVAGKLKEKFTALGTEELQFIDRTQVALVNKVHERTGLDRDTAERQVEALVAGLVAPAQDHGGERVEKAGARLGDTNAERGPEKLADKAGDKQVTKPVERAGAKDGPTQPHAKA